MNFEKKNIAFQVITTVEYTYFVIESLVQGEHLAHRVDVKQGGCDVTGDRVSLQSGLRLAVTRAQRRRAALDLLGEPGQR